ncbi:LmbE family N-acetylglucosaminyl deacetylase [Sedimentibacter acidaminivorans]|uniref:LmbE family N-acetylglucosaminyl deacetylase n=1 Tax=Sedimentibacter acidaminivorans TaxID=913099 RepID=A0ABS4GDC1_9FIRM|nr:PIG-L family deacetylase [Sedimentibacter acidaminivorans]MBP1925705.1 LmbE family N-acetylglucosaminyl deacetylase [Sedimentibacter acidaminivorans]
MDKFLIVATHPDDETLGSGGLMLRKKAEGNEVFVLNMTHMTSSYGYSDFNIKKRDNEINNMINAYGLNGYYNLNLKPSGLDTYFESELIQKISKVFNDVQPSILILPYYKDVHSDHRITFKLCYSCTKNFRYPFIKKVLMMETPSETDFSFYEDAFKPNYYVNISEYIDKKVEIASIFKSEVSEHPFPRSVRNIRAYGTIRGAVIGADSAEAFVLVKSIE